ncbi:MAG: AAA family ATPase [Chloroflexi bacterium AL-W]|nr:AAA family ATPase [Chloroflexi bacterium AL-N1]NOK64921.1 AAA family ATPase [Chloroflexi bacterium AL-N10]NOK76691.1 AAA family ATPase [Chloroflexi bacterium AL-N5]NOK84582.1 AAA family ATPase [Chloroflexi bacterium AL-W]NOK86593.1 AAA family ATPase [Chloroflexi bacterium AL-N15]
MTPFKPKRPPIMGTVIFVVATLGVAVLSILVSWQLYRYANRPITDFYTQLGQLALQIAVVVIIGSAEMLGFALISKDHIKETLFAALNGEPGDLAYLRQLGGAAMELLWALVARCPQVVLEARFRPHSDYERSRIAALGG